MEKINLRDIQETEWKSPKGKYHAFSKEVSIALGRDPRSLEVGRRHPFDLELTRVPPGASVCPFHSHSAQWELYLIVAGRALVRHDGGSSVATEGDAILFRPGQAHQISNDSPSDLLFYVIADNPIGECCYYPDSHKWLVNTAGTPIVIRGREADYLEGEE